MRLTTRQELDNGINVTPMIDVLLVLLVIFMLAMQLRMILNVQVPTPASQEPGEGAPQLILDLRSDGSYALNQQVVAFAALEARLRNLFAGTGRKALYVRAAPLRRYREVIEAIDLAKGAGVPLVAFMP